MAGIQHFDKEFRSRRVFRRGQDKKVHQNESEGSHTSKSAVGVGLACYACGVEEGLVELLVANLRVARPVRSSCRLGHHTCQGRCNGRDRLAVSCGAM